jgi:ferredoxin
VTQQRQDALARSAATLAAIVGLLAAGWMTTDYAVQRLHTRGDEARVAQLQTDVRRDAAAAPVLAAELDRITRARLARRARADVLAIVLIASAAAFVGCAKWRMALGPRRPPAPPAPPRKAIRLRQLKEALIRYRVTDACTGCTLCAQACRTGAIAYRPYEKHEIVDERCTWCDKCVEVCQDGAIEVVYQATGAPAPRPGRPRPLAS